MRSYVVPYARAFQAWTVLAILTTAAALIWLAPARWRPRRPWVAVAAAVTGYLSVSVLYEVGFVEWIDHDVLSPLGGGTDDIATWLVGAGGALAVVAVAGAVRRR